jgi:hypothetical protein
MVVKLNFFKKKVLSKIKSKKLKLKSKKLTKK